MAQLKMPEDRRNRTRHVKAVEAICRTAVSCIGIRAAKLRQYH